MKAFHSFWSKPNTCRNQGAVEFPDFELLTMILSALKWREHNGEIRMITDTPGAEYFRRIGLENLWDEMDTSLDRIGKQIDPFLFWAAGKLFALNRMEAPCVMLDTDLIIWKNIDSLQKNDIIAAHFEDLNPYVYPDQSTFKLKPGYQFPTQWDFSLKAANTAFLYIEDSDFKNHYVKQAMDFFENVEIEGLNPVTAMCFAEQRILPMCAEAEGKKIGYLLSLQHPDDQEIVTHTWGYKQMLRDNPQKNREFCDRCIRRILKDYPQWEECVRGTFRLTHSLQNVSGETPL